MKIIFSSLLYLIIILILIEVFFRITEISTISYRVDDPIVGSKLLPNTDLIYFNEGFYVGGINKYGYLGEGYPKVKSNGTLRVALIGDSYVEAYQIFYRDHFGKILEKGLTKKTQAAVEVLNFGRSGFNLSDYYCLNEDFCKSFNSDYTLFFISDEDFNLSTTNTNRKPFCFLEKESLKIDYSFSESSIFQARIETQRFRGKSIFLGLLNRAKESIQKGFFLNIFFDKFSYLFETPKSNFNKKITPKLSSLHKSILQNIAIQNNSIFVLRNNLNENILEFLTKINARVISLEPILKNEYKKNDGSTNELYFWKTTGKYGHWNHKAHSLIGNYLVDKLNQQNKKKY